MLQTTMRNGPGLPGSEQCFLEDMLNVYETEDDPFEVLVVVRNAIMSRYNGLGKR